MKLEQHLPVCFVVNSATVLNKTSQSQTDIVFTDQHIFKTVVDVLILGRVSPEQCHMHNKSITNNAPIRKLLIKIQILNALTQQSWIHVCIKYIQDCGKNMKMQLVMSTG